MVMGSVRDLLGGLDRRAFVATHESLFLVKEPASDAQEATTSPEAISYKTRHVDEESLIDAAAFSGQWWVGEIRKRAGNPFPDRISIGRAPNCDVVIRVSFVSKLHAHFLVGADSELRLSDLRSANGTRLNGRELVASISAVVHAGDKVRLGAVELSVVDAGALHDLLSRI